ncbi:MAG: N-6 DNA methylase [Sedimentisphaerales bacterium]|nr:N-6 DNA methylase [Sedimentisphaerales bacterium]
MAKTIKKSVSDANSKAQTPADVIALVQRFADHAEAYRAGQYNETQLRREFLDPLFKALGWDVDNTSGYGEAYKDVIHEDAIKIGGATKAPDYCFRIGGTRKFFLEAKKPSVDIKGDPGPAYQLRRYAWSAKLPLSILSDFQEFAVYDCRVKPNKTDQASTARIMYFTYEDLPEKWGEFADIFAKEAILKGSFDKFADSSKRKRGTAEVDDAFLAEIEQWRDTLAHNLALRNSGLSQRDLNFAVQRTIDRIIFLRICEDRGIEPYGTLLGLTNGDKVYARLFERFHRADERYNSGLFHFTKEKGRPEAPDDLTPALNIDDKPLKDILKRLYYPESPYEFSVLPADILGQVYEQFLGKVIRLTAGHRAVVEEKPEVRKAGGVYYTPTYIVDYIVKHTAGKLVEGKTPQEVGGLTASYQPSKAKGARPLAVLDPACGSGSFLLGAYQFLLDWYRDQYITDGPKQHATGKSPRLYQHASGDWRLTTAERKRILLAHIYGVDIDPQAVETTKLSLLLKVLEGESAENLNAGLRLFHERALPDLADNIKCGNSLIGPDFYDNQQMNMFDEEERLHINVFDWPAEFPDIFQQPHSLQNRARKEAAQSTHAADKPLPDGRGSDPDGGFDAVIGNPPYGIVFDETMKSYFEERYPTFGRNNDSFVAFVERSMRLVAHGGAFGFIIPNTCLLGPYFDHLKEFLVDNSIVTAIVDFGTCRVFAQPNVFTCLLLVRRWPHLAEAHPEAEYLKVDDVALFPEHSRTIPLSTDTLRSLRWVPCDSVTEHLRKHPHQLDEAAFVKDVGLNYWTKGRGKKRGGSIADRILYSGAQVHPNDRRYIKGRDIDRYSVLIGNQWLRHDYEKRLHPAVDVFRFSPEFLEREKIVYRQTADRIIAAIDQNGDLTDKTVHVVVLREAWADRLDLRYVLGILNSKLMLHLYRSSAHEKSRTFAQVKTFRVRTLPMYLPKFIEHNDKARHDRMVEVVQQMLDLHKQLAAAKTAHGKTAIQRQIDATDRQIDQLVYELYGLTDAEIKIIEEAGHV